MVILKLLLFQLFRSFIEPNVERIVERKGAQLVGYKLTDFFDCTRSWNDWNRIVFITKDTLDHLVQTIIRLEIDELKIVFLNESLLAWCGVY